MAISDGQKIDYLFKKVGFGITKTDTNSNKVAANESIASPLLLRGDKVIKDAASIPSTKPGSSSGVVTVYTGATTVECTSDITATANRTWKTGLTDWIPPEFGSTYLVNVYIHTSGDASNAESISNKVFITGSGNDDEWFFDYQSGVLNFIGTNLPNGIDFTGKSVYIAGARYTGDFGVGGSTGAFSFTDNRLQTTTTNEEIIIEPAGTGYVAIDSTSGLVIPVGTTAQRPTGQTGMFRFNTTDGQVEVYNGTSWTGVGSTESVTLDEFDGDGSTVAFTLSRTGTSASVWVSINGTVQEVTNTYTVSGTTLTFNEAPVTGDKIQVRNFFSANTTNVSTSIIQDADNDTKIQVEESADEDTIRFDVSGTELVNVNSNSSQFSNRLSLTNIHVQTVLGSTNSGSPTALPANKNVYIFDNTPDGTTRYYSLPDGNANGEIILLIHKSFGSGSDPSITASGGNVGLSRNGSSNRMYYWYDSEWHQMSKL